MRIMPLGGLGEVGKNLMVYESDGEIVVVDAGLAFPRDEHLGVDLVLPDFAYLRDDADRVRAVLLTHAHEDHVGALPYLLREVRVPEVWATRLTLGLLAARSSTSTACAQATELREAGRRAAPSRSARSARSSSAWRTRSRTRVAIALEAGRPADPPHRRLQARPHAGRRVADRRRPARRDRQPRRRPHARRLDERRAPRLHAAPSGSSARRSARSSRARQGRVLVASFASNVHRMQQAVDVAVETGRKVCIIGRSMRKNLNIARNLGYLEAPDDTFIRPAELDELAPHEAMILCTGSQGEPMSALTRIAYNDHPAVTRRARRHGDPLREAGAGERAARARHDQPAREGRGGGAPPGDRARARLRARELRGDPDDARARPPEGGHAGPRRVPHARGARAAGAGRRRARPARSCSPRTARSSSSTRAGRGSSIASRPASPSSTGSEWGTCATWRSATGGTCPRTAC